jgi:NitT/TauT family transport system permease protein
MRRAGWIRLALGLAAFLVLEAACRGGLVDRMSVPPPSEMLLGAWRVLRDAETQRQFATTLITVAQACVLAIVAGFALGLLLHRLPRIRNAIDPFLATYYAVPTFVFYPLFVVLFGLGRAPLVAIGFLFAVVAMAISTLDGLGRVPRVFLRSARAMHLGRVQTLRKIILPAAAPWLFTGVKFAISYAFIGVIAGEFVQAGAGIGFAIAFAYNSFDNQAMYGLIVALFAIVGLLNSSLWLWEQRIYERRGRR